MYMFFFINKGFLITLAITGVQVLSIPVLLLACLWLTESEQATPVDSINDVVGSSM